MKASCLFLLLAIPGQGLRVPDSASSQNNSLNLERLEEGHVPPLFVHKLAWKHHYHMDRHIHEPMNSSVKLVVGVFTIASEGPYRQVARETWMQQQGVCYWQSTPRPDCNVYVAFVIAKNGTGTKKKIPESVIEESHREKGMFILDIEENMNEGKSFHWFAAAAQAFPWATHIGKMDMDTYPFLHKLIYRMEQNRSCVATQSPYEIIGRPQGCSKSVTHCAKNFTQICPPSDCAGQFSSHLDTVPIGGQWHYLAGAFYILSMPLVQRMSWVPASGVEDITVTARVNGTMADMNECVVLRRLDTFAHSFDFPRPEDISSY